MKKANHGSLRAALISYTIALYGLWSIWELWGKSQIDSAVANACLSQIIQSGIIKNLVWTLPAIWLARRFQSEVAIPLKEMFCTKVNFLKYLPVFLFFTLYILTGSILKYGKLEIVSGFGLDEVIIVLFVGLTEEMVFRGWLLNATVRGDRKWIPVALNAAMFLVIHFPKWIQSGIFISSFTSLAFLELFALSAVFSCTFLKSRNILVPIALHMYWDLLVFMFI